VKKRKHHKQSAFAALAVVPLAALALSACSGSNPDDSAGGSSSQSSGDGTPSAPSDDPCTEERLLASLPSGAMMEKFNCARAGDEEWAAAKVSPGDTRYFLRWSGTAWTAETSIEVCGAASAGLPHRLLAYCPR
jgi:hypothetical protein